MILLGGKGNEKHLKSATLMFVLCCDICLDTFFFFFFQTGFCHGAVSLLFLSKEPMLLPRALQHPPVTICWCFPGLVHWSCPTDMWGAGLGPLLRVSRLLDMLSWIIQLPGFVHTEEFFWMCKGFQENVFIFFSEFAYILLTESWP